MTPKQKAKQLIDRYVDIMPCLQIQTGNLIIEHAKKCALICVQEIELSLIDYGRESMELQNMDSEFRFFSEVKAEINSFKF